MNATHEVSLFPQGIGRFSFAPLLLANVAHYHGHLCPELAIGYRAALFAQQELGLSREKAHHVLEEKVTAGGADVDKRIDMVQGRIK